MEEKELTWEMLEEALPVINARELERRAGLRVRRIGDCKAGKSTLSEAELECIRQILKKLIT